VGVAVFADELRTMVKRRSSLTQWRSIVNCLKGEPVQASTDIVKVTDQVLGKITNRALFVIISDLFEDAAAIRQALARFRHRGHDVILLHTLDRQEMSFDYSQPAPFEGLEGEGRVRIDPRALREAYLEAIGDHIETVEKAARSFGFDYHLINTHEQVGPPLGYVLARRNAQEKRRRMG
jgi:hypothetical protein